MKCRPLNYHRDRSSRQLTVQNHYWVDSHLNLVLSIERVEVRWWMIIIVHANDDPEKSTQLRHREIISCWQRSSGETPFGRRAIAF